jgi:hypothetical protein
MSAIINADELVDVVDETNTILLGTATRKQVHSTGQYHRAVNVLLFNSDNQILLQKRMPTKELCPNAWDLSVRLFKMLFILLIYYHHIHNVFLVFRAFATFRILRKRRTSGSSRRIKYYPSGTL